MLYQQLRINQLQCEIHLLQHHRRDLCHHRLHRQQLGIELALHQQVLSKYQKNKTQLFLVLLAQKGLMFQKM
jgi:hypothetical protein